MEDGRRRWGESFIWDSAPQSAPRPSVRWMPSSYRGRQCRRGLHLAYAGVVQGSSIALVRNDSAQAQPGLLALIRFRGKLEE